MTITSPGPGTPCRCCLVEWGWWGEPLGRSLKKHTVMGWNPARSPSSGWLIQARLTFASKHLHDWLKLGRRWSSSIAQASYQDNKAQEEIYEDVGGQSPDLNATEHLWRQLKLPVPVENQPREQKGVGQNPLELQEISDRQGFLNQHLTDVLDQIRISRSEMHIF